MAKTMPRPLTTPTHPPCPLPQPAITPASKRTVQLPQSIVEELRLSGTQKPTSCLLGAAIPLRPPPHFHCRGLVLDLGGRATWSPLLLQLPASTHPSETRCRASCCVGHKKAAHPRRPTCHTGPFIVGVTGLLPLSLKACADMR